MVNGLNLRSPPPPGRPVTGCSMTDGTSGLKATGKADQFPDAGPAAERLRVLFCEFARSEWEVESPHPKFAPQISTFPPGGGGRKFPPLVSDQLVKGEKTAPFRRG